MRSVILFLAGLLAALSTVAQAENIPTDSVNTKPIPYATLTAGLLVPNPEPMPGTDVGTFGLPIHIKMTATYGMWVNPRTSLGLGTGLVILDRGILAPVFVEARGDFLKRDITPTWYGQFGSVIPMYGGIDEIEDWWGNPLYEEFKARGGLMFDVGIGLKVKNNNKSATMLSIGFQTMNLEESYRSWGTKYENKYQFQRLSIQGGWMF